jgi:phthalate 4,5-dioxygenase
MLSKEENELLTRTGPGTPVGELFRRFWLPAMLSSELPGPDCPPVKLTILSEELVAFRDSDGKIGVLDRYCPHRGSSLFWGRNEESGLRCVYHGWKFDVDGTCVDMPNEPVESRFREKIHTVAYPTQERAGVIWIYMGPRELHPEMPELEWTFVPDDHRYVSKRITACNYLQNVEGEVDSAHVSFLHGRARREESRYDSVLSRYEANDSTPRFTVKRADHGLLIGARRSAGDEGYYWRITPFFMPSYTVVPSAPDQAKLGTLAVPLDDDHMMGFTVSWRTDRPLNEAELAWCTTGDGSHVSLIPGTFNMVQTKANNYQIDREEQRRGSFTGIRGVRTQDVAVQEDQWGPVTKRWREHLGTTDLAVIALRRLLLQSAANLQKGIEPPEAHNGAAYRIRSVAVVLKPDVDFADGARELMAARA